MCSCTALGPVLGLSASDKVLVEEVTVLLLRLPNTAVTLTVQLFPGVREEMVWVVPPPLATGSVPDVDCEPHNN